MYIRKIFVKQTVSFRILLKNEYKPNDWFLNGLTVLSNTKNNLVLNLQTGNSFA